MVTDNIVNVIGHKNPDTDSVCSAIAYARLKCEVTGKKYVARCAGQINSETDFVLKRFKVPVPGYIRDVRTQVVDIDVERVQGVGEDISIKKAWEIMKTNMLQTLPIVNNSKKLIGLLTIQDIAKSYMDVYDSRIIATARTPFSNIVQTLEGEMVYGNSDEKIETGKCLIAAANPDLMESYIEKGDIVILGNRYESQLCAIEMDAKCIIVCDGATVSFTITKLAKNKECFIIKTPYDTFTASRLINQSIPIKFFMKSENLVTFGLGEFLDDIRDIMTKKKYRDFPILDWNDNYFGMISRRSLLGARKKKLILVDHNEPSQSVDGIEEAELLEIIDHHRIGSIETMAPVFFRNQPLGCTATIIYQMYGEAGVKIPKDTAGLLCSAILSDTLMYRSPTCTEVDKKAAEALALIAGINVEQYASEMFATGSTLSSKSPEEIFYHDFKKFDVGEKKFGVGQITSMIHSEFNAIKTKLIPYMKKVLPDLQVSMLFFMLTDIMQESTELLYAGSGAKELAEAAFRKEGGEESMILENIVSRKKQIIPAMVTELQEET